jgi:hypothetical protein
MRGRACRSQEQSTRWQTRVTGEITVQHARDDTINMSITTATTALTTTTTTTTTTQESRGHVWTAAMRQCGVPSCWMSLGIATFNSAELRPLIVPYLPWQTPHQHTSITNTCVHHKTCVVTRAPTRSRNSHDSAFRLGVRRRDMAGRSRRQDEGCTESARARSISWL